MAMTHTSCSQCRDRRALRPGTYVTYGMRRSTRRISTPPGQKAALPAGVSRSGAVLIATVADPPPGVSADDVVVVASVEDGGRVQPIRGAHGVDAPRGQVDDRAATVGILVDPGDVDVRHQMGARMDLGSRHEFHDLVEADQSNTAIEDLPDGVVGEDVAQLLGFEPVERVGVPPGSSMMSRRSSAVSFTACTLVFRRIARP